MLLSDEIRGRLAEVFSLKSYKIDHVVHGAIASAATYGAMMGATAPQIESAIGMVVAHYIPFRAIRAGKQLSDSKGASAAISTEAAIMCVKRSMAGFMGPRDIFRNPEAIFRFFEPTSGVDANKDLIDITLGNKVRWGPGDSPFNIVLSHSGSDFAVMGMHFKLGLYEHQSAGAIEGIKRIFYENPEILSADDDIEQIEITSYEPAFGIIGDPAKLTPTTRQSADHSMVYIISRLIKKAKEIGPDAFPDNEFDTWKTLMLDPFDYGADSMDDEVTRGYMQKFKFVHGGEKYDNDYPDGIPTSLTVHTKSGKSFESGYVMYPPGHARNTSMDLPAILAAKNELLGKIAVEDVASCVGMLDRIESLSAEEMLEIYNHPFRTDAAPIDGPGSCPAHWE